MLNGPPRLLGGKLAFLEISVGDTAEDTAEESLQVLYNCCFSLLSFSCLCDEIKGTQELRTCSHADSLPCCRCLSYTSACCLSLPLAASLFKFRCLSLPLAASLYHTPLLATCLYTPLPTSLCFSAFIALSRCLSFLRYLACLNLSLYLSLLFSLPLSALLFTYLCSSLYVSLCLSVLLCVAASLIG